MSGQSYLNDIIAFLTFAQPLTQAFLAAITLYIYDTILTFGDEQELIWRYKCNFGTILYIFARYGGLAILPTSFVSIILLSNVTAIESPKACLITSVISNVFAIPAFIGVQGLLVALPYSYKRVDRAGWFSGAGCGPESPSTVQQTEILLILMGSSFAVAISPFQNA
ncbi:hypothetical protein Clacol_004806 [Clathrus columnatus]|uniref:DUF6533 domain-containing protein n=1 Tax=Clathrus columnatus TaxID=1419009 RepID=A0AAV5ABJ0_9AGAM|nr:hypothetical protein Clacol_004806 [Clathrus columnatus]